VNGNTFHADYKRWTDTAIDITKQYLQAQGRQKSITKEKILKLQAENAKHLTPKGITALAVHLRVETGDGLTRTLLGRGYGWESWNKKRMAPWCMRWNTCSAMMRSLLIFLNSCRNST